MRYTSYSSLSQPFIVLVYPMMHYKIRQEKIDTHVL